MNKARLTWSITGSGHYIEKCPDFLPPLDNGDLTVVTLIHMHSMETARKYR